VQRFDGHNKCLTMERMMARFILLRLVAFIGLTSASTAFLALPYLV
jgi:hypothetical protein